MICDFGRISQENGLPKLKHLQPMGIRTVKPETYVDPIIKRNVLVQEVSAQADGTSKNDSLPSGNKYELNPIISREDKMWIGVLVLVAAFVFWLIFGGGVSTLNVLFYGK